ncbi:SIMPL domain-containing protein [Betaproteobacteria bacterium]|nr:SIMPL domain-containing protein [Betaproteobacteria bacterium]GHU40616.1 SIMPL domain-containing protein [Betaproteobacteria bacterium]
MSSNASRSTIIASVFLALGLIIAAYLLGTRFKTIGDNHQQISVKGLAEKSVKADAAQWTVGVKVHANTYAQALEQLRQARPVLDEFLNAQGFPRETWTEGPELIAPHMVDDPTSERYRQIQQGFNGTQSIRIETEVLDKVGAAYKAIVQIAADGAVTYRAPEYTIKDLENIKMSLIGDATKNAHTRAAEFAKEGGVKVGAMRSASQGAFYILAADGNEGADDYGGSIDTTTINKRARVVVTIVYGID